MGLFSEIYQTTTTTTTTTTLSQVQNTSFKRGDSGLPADVKIRTIFQLIGIVVVVVVVV